MRVIYFITISVILGLELAGIIFYRKDTPKGAIHAGTLLTELKHKLANKTRRAPTNYPNVYFEKIYVGEDVEKKRKEKEAKTFGLVLVIIFAGSTLLLCANVIGIWKSKYIKAINRPENGNKIVGLTAEYDGEELELELDVSSPSFSQREKELELEKTYENLEKLILGNNADLEHVTEKLNFKDTYGKTGISAYYMSSDYRVVDSSGNVYSKNLAEEKKVQITVNLSQGENEKSKIIFVTVCPLAKAYQDKNLIINDLNELGKVNEESRNYELPSQINGKPVRFKTKNDNYEYILVFIVIVIAMLIVPLEKSKQKEELRKRNEELIYDYTELISKLILLLEAGLTVRRAFERIAGSYEIKRKQNLNCKRRFLYEEMCITKKEIELGKSEGAAYESFGTRCRLISYIRVSQLLSRSVKKGGGSLVDSLKVEATEAVKERTEAIKIKGEKIKGKLLIPLMGIFSLILAIILIPSILSL